MSTPSKAASAPAAAGSIASPTRKRTAASSGLRRASAIISRDASMATISASAYDRTSARVDSPVPQQRSSARARGGSAIRRALQARCFA